MSWTKRQIITEAYAELALAGYNFDLQPEELQTALRKLDAMMATWAGRGVEVGYAFGASPDASDLDQDSGLPLVATEAVYLGLAVALAAGMGKTLPRSTTLNAKTAYDGLLSYVANQEVCATPSRRAAPCPPPVAAPAPAPLLSYIVLATAGQPGNGIGADGYYAINFEAGVYYVKTAGVWGDAVALPGSGGGGGSTPLANNLLQVTSGLKALDAAQGPVITGLIDALASATGAALSGKFPNPTGTTGQYVRGDGSLATFPAFGSGTVTSVGLTAPAAGITVTGATITGAGSFAIGLANDLAAVEGLSATGLVRRTGTDAWSAGTAVDLASEVSGLLPVARGGTGTATPGIVAGTNVTVSGTWPNQTVNSTAGGGGSGTVTNTGGVLTLNALMLGAGSADSKVLGSLGTTTTVLHGNASGIPSFGAVSLTADVSGTLPVSNGGTGVASLTAYAPLFGGTTGTGAVQSGAVGTAGQVLTSNGASALPTMQDQNKPPINTVAGSRNLAAGDILAELTNASGSYTLTIPTGLGAFGDIIWIHPTGTGSLTVVPAVGVTLTDGTLATPAALATITISASQLAAFQCDGTNAWTLVGISVSGAADAAIAQSITPGGRLTLTSGVPVTTSDVTGATSVYYTPYKSNVLPLWTGTAWRATTFTETTLALGTLTASLPYDVFAYLSSGVLALELLAWTSDSARATAVTLQDGRYCKSGDKTRLYLGSFRTTSTTTTEDSRGGTTTQVGGRRFLWNMYNREERRASVIDTTSSWSYPTATVRQANAASGNKIEILLGLASPIRAILLGEALIYNNVSQVARCGVGVDSTTAFSGLVQSAFNNSTNGQYFPLSAIYASALAAGYHAVNWCEAGADGNCSFIGSGFGNQTGLIAEIMA